MTASERTRGNITVGYINDLSAVETGAILYLRLWLDSAESQARVRNNVAGALGATRGRSAVEHLDKLCALIAQHARHPLMRHPIQCRYVGAHEAMFATMVSSAAAGDEEDATLFAALMVRSDPAPSIATHAQQFGLALKTIARVGASPVTHTSQGNQRLH